MYVDDLFVTAVSVEAIECVTGPLGQVFNLICLGPICQYLGWTIERNMSAGWLKSSHGKYFA